ncbi:MAG: DUF5684 domain-containing protein [Anaerolineae bacterium]|nr:DUF5684 domain-containing protein [Anaerolineae bacterium]
MEDSSLALNCISLIVSLIALVALWVLYTKANEPGWATIIPFYNYWVLLRIVGRPGWWLLLMFVPFVNFFVMIVVYMDLAEAFGQDRAYGCGMMILPFFLLPMLAFGDNQYSRPVH